jgi:hypothetical protein
MDTLRNTIRLGIYGAIVNIAGIVLSGPPALILITLVHPNPAWQSAQVWVENFHPIQTLPFFAGFLLLGGYVVMLAVAHQLAEAKDRVYTQIALLFTAAFVTLIFFNYINQTTFLPALARSYRPEFDPIITAFSFANPQSLCWAIEMWGYALLGVATWLAAVVFKGNLTERITAWLMIANGIFSLAGGFVSSANLGWVMTTPGLVNYAVWNVLVLFLSIFFLLSLRKRLAQVKQWSATGEAVNNLASQAG